MKKHARIAYLLKTRDRREAFLVYDVRMEQGPDAPYFIASPSDPKLAEMVYGDESRDGLRQHIEANLAIKEHEILGVFEELLEGSR